MRVKTTNQGHFLKAVGIDLGGVETLREVL